MFIYHRPLNCAIILTLQHTSHPPFSWLLDISGSALGCRLHFWGHPGMAFCGAHETRRKYRGKCVLFINSLLLVEYLQRREVTVNVLPYESEYIHRDERNDLESTSGRSDAVCGMRSADKWVWRQLSSQCLPCEGCDAKYKWRCVIWWQYTNSSEKPVTGTLLLPPWRWRQ
jgi:hypothetical protein